MLSKYLPSKKIVAIFIIPIIVIGIILIWNQYLSNDDGQKQSQLENDFNAIVDSDKDGLEDWEEDLVGTDKNKKDTDGDGFSDSLEVRTGSDPLDPLNKEKKRREVEKELESGNLNYDYRLDSTLTNTDRLAYQFLEEGVKIKKSGLSGNKDLQEKIVNKILSQNTIDINLNKYDISDIKISNVNENKFKEKIVDIFRDMYLEDLVEETFLLNQYITFKDDKYLDQIDNNLKIYKKYLNRMIGLETPIGLDKLFLDFINAFNAELESIEFYKTIKNDPVSLVQIMAIYKEIDAHYNKSAENLFEAIKE